MIFVAGFFTGFLATVLGFAIWLGGLSWEESKKWAKRGVKPHTLDVWVIDGDNQIDPLLKRKQNIHGQ